MAEGARRAGLEIAMSFDWSEDACDSYEANHGHRPIQLDVDELLHMARVGWRPEPIDLLIADPPCTPWSRAGKRQGTADKRDMLEATVELVELLRPRAYLIANVPGLDDSPNWPVVQRTIGGLSSAGYCVVDFARLDAADYGVPQHRVRPFWFGHLDGPCLTWPARTHGAGADLVALPGIAPLLPYVTCRAALQHLSTEDLGKPIRLRQRDCSTDQHGSVPDKPARTVGTSNLSDGNVLVSGPTPRRHPRHRTSSTAAPARTMTNGHALLVHARHPVSKADKPSYVVTTKGDGRGAQGACVVWPWPWDRPSTTVTTRDVVPPPGHHPESGSILSQPGAIKLSEKAAAILQGFPETWRFCGRTKAARWDQIGMAMPPGLAEPVFRAIARRSPLTNGSPRRVVC